MGSHLRPSGSAASLRPSRAQTQVFLSPEGLDACDAPRGTERTGSDEDGGHACLPASLKQCHSLREGKESAVGPQAGGSAVGLLQPVARLLELRPGWGATTPTVLLQVCAQEMLGRLLTASGQHRLPAAPKGVVRPSGSCATRESPQVREAVSSWAEAMCTGEPAPHAGRGPSLISSSLHPNPTCILAPGFWKCHGPSLWTSAPSSPSSAGQSDTPSFMSQVKGASSGKLSLTTIPIPSPQVTC